MKIKHIAKNYVFETDDKRIFIEKDEAEKHEQSLAIINLKKYAVPEYRYLNNILDTDILSVYQCSNKQEYNDFIETVYNIYGVIDINTINFQTKIQICNESSFEESKEINFYVIFNKMEHSIVCDELKTYYIMDLESFIDKMDFFKLQLLTLLQNIK